MELNSEQVGKVDALALSNTVTLSALVGLLIQKGLFSADELTEEIRLMRNRMGLTRPDAAQP